MVDRDNDARTPTNTVGATQKTTDYDQFKTLDGNRKILTSNVRKLIRSMVEYGNLTANVPILVNENFEVIDGQHRLEALKQLGWPVYFRMEEGLNLTVVRALNNTGANWTWRDYATSYAPHKHAYQLFLELSEKYSFGWSILTLYSDIASNRRRSNDFVAGDFEFPDYDKTCEMLQLAYDISQMVGFKYSAFMRALHTILGNPDTDRERLLHKIELFGKQVIKPVIGEAEYMREIEDCYNFKAEEANRQRLF